MGFRMRTAVLAAASALLVASFVPMAVAGTPKGDANIWRDGGERARHGDRFGNDKGGFPRGPRGGRPPSDESPVAPVPEPGTMALLSLGLVSLAAGLRKRRAGRATVRGTAL